jgi:type IV secretory pathway VirJ component
MARRFSTLFLLLGLIPAVSGAAPASFKFGRLGTVPVVRPAGDPSQVAILFSSEHGFGAREAAMAQALAAAGALVFEVDTQRYFATGSRSTDTHFFPAAEFETMSQIGQREMGLTTYRQPILVGTGAGAGVAYVALAQAPANTFAGAVADNFCEVIPSHFRFRRGNHLSWDKTWPGPGIRVLPDAAIENPWVVFGTAGKTACPVGPLSDFVKDIDAVQMIPPPAGVPPQDAWKKQLPQALTILAAKHREEEAAQAARGELRDLPLNEIKAEGAEKDVLAVIVTGSGGYVGLDRKMGNQLSSRGVPVVGLSSLAYFWKPRNPDGTARDLTRILDHYMAAWHKSRAIVIGYSQGADVVPFMVDRMAPALRAKIGLVALIGPDGAAQFDLHPDGWISNRQQSPDLPVMPEIPKLKGNRVLCIYGAAEEKSLCKQIAPKQASIIEVPGDHGFEGDAPKLIERFLAEAGLAPAAAAPAKARKGGL